MARASTMRPVMAVVLAVALSGCTFLTGERPPEPAPVFDFVDVDGVAWNNSVAEGRIILVDFMGTWCGPCQRAIPMMHDLLDAYPELTILSISGTDTEQQLQDFRTQYGADWSFARDDQMVRDFLAASTSTEMLWPSYAIIDQQGDLVFYNRGETLPVTFTAVIDGLATQKAPAGSGAIPLIGLSAVLGAAAYGSPFLLRHTLGPVVRPQWSPLVALGIYVAIGIVAAWYSRPLTGRVVNATPFLVAGAVIAVVYWRVKGTDAVQASGKRIDGEGGAHLAAFWGNGLWYALPVWGAILHAGMLRTAPWETFAMLAAFGVGLAGSELMRRRWTEPVAPWLGVAALAIGALWNGVLYLR